MTTATISIADKPEELIKNILRMFINELEGLKNLNKPDKAAY